MSKDKLHIWAIAAVIAIAGCNNSSRDSSVSGQPGVGSVKWPSPESAVKIDPAIEQRVDELLASMTVEQKVGQMIQPELRQITPEDIKEYHVGSVLNGGGAFPGNNKYAKISDWVETADAFYNASMDASNGGIAIPIMWGTDAVHGHTNIIGATVFPHNIGLGATRNPDLIRKIGEVTAREVAVTGIDWNFSPTLAVVRDDRWGRTYESYAEHPEVVRAYAGAMVEGLQGKANTDQFMAPGKVIATAKHFIADGGTTDGVDRGDAVMSEKELMEIHGAGYVTALEAGVQSVMASFNSWNGEELHGHKYLLTDVLKGQMNFDGLVVGDWNGHEFVPGCTKTSCAQSINAGVDILMAPDADWKTLYANTVEQINQGIISQERVDDAVRRILRVKLRAGLFEKGAPSSRPYAGKEELIGAPEHLAVARQAVRESLVLLKNKNNVLPLSRNVNVLVAGDGADDIGKQSGGWTISWQGTGNSNEDFPGGSSIYGGIVEVVEAAGGSATLSEDGSYTSKPDVAIIVFGEDPYAEMQGDVGHLDYESKQGAAVSDLDLLRKLQSQGVPVISLFISGRPLYVNPELNASDAFVAVWLPGSQGAGVADVIFRDAEGNVNHDFKGKLPFSWPARPDQTQLNVGQDNYDPLFAYGYGLTYSDEDTLSDNLPVDHSKTAADASQQLQIFDNRPMPPWKARLIDGTHNVLKVTSSTANLPTVKLQAVDRLVQEDSRRMVWNGSGVGIVGFFADTRSDISEFATDDSALVLTVKVDRKPAANVFVGMECGRDCGAEQSITDRLETVAAGEWETVSVDMSCFTNSGFKPDMVLSPFYLKTDGALDLTVYDVHIQRGVQDVDVSCD
jgi:beta-glucosidase